MQKKEIYRNPVSLLSLSSLPVSGSVPFVELLRRSAAEAQKRPHPWAQQLQAVRGVLGSDGVERISTQALFDFLELPQKDRTPANCRALSALMRDKGWTAVRSEESAAAGIAIN